MKMQKVTFIKADYKKCYKMQTIKKIDDRGVDVIFERCLDRSTPFKLLDRGMLDVLVAVFQSWPTQAYSPDHLRVQPRCPGVKKLHC